MQKLLVLAAVVAVVWYGFKFLGRLKDQRDREAKLNRDGKARGGTAQADSRRERAQTPVEAEEMVKCRACGAYVSAHDAGNCGKAGCPF